MTSQQEMGEADIEYLFTSLHEALDSMEKTVRESYQHILVIEKEKWTRQNFDVATATCRLARKRIATLRHELRILEDHAEFGNREEDDTPIDGVEEWRKMAGYTATDLFEKLNRVQGVIRDFDEAEFKRIQRLDAITKSMSKFKIHQRRLADLR